MKRINQGLALLALLAASAAAQAQGGGPVYRCPGPPILYTDAISEKEAKERGCKAIEGAPVTVIQSQKPRPVAAANTPRSAETKVSNDDQKARDADAKRILEEELRREEEKLAALQREFNNGEPERQGNERNFAKYQERVAEMKASIARKESDIAALKRELAKISQ